MYYAHPSEALNRAYVARPFQGTIPENASYVFVGLDANYSPAVEQHSIFPDLLEYLDDGVAFWRSRGVHHPFLLPAYRGDGRKYHKTFAQIGFSAANAADVSFIELMHLPTYGRSALHCDDFDTEHLRWLNAVIEHGRARHVFVPARVAALMRKSGLFPWIPDKPMDVGEELKVWRRTAEKTVYLHYHFSVYGAFEEEKRRQLQAIGRLIDVSR